MDLSLCTDCHGENWPTPGLLWLVELNRAIHMYLSLCTDRHGLPQILDLTETCLGRRLQSVARLSDDLPRVMTKSITLIVEAQLAQCSSKSDHKYTRSSSGRAKYMVPPTRILLDLCHQITQRTWLSVHVHLIRNISSSSVSSSAFVDLHL